MSDPNQPNDVPQPGEFQQPSQPTGQPYGEQPGQPYGQQPGQPYGQQPSQPHPQQPGQPYGQPAGQPYGQPVSKVGQPGELVDRFLARLIDFAILMVAGSIVIGFLVVSLLMGGNFGFFGSGGSSFLSNLVSSVLMAALYLGYFAYLESSRGQTLGKMVMKLETRGPDGGRPTMEQAIKRNIWVALGILGVLPLIGGLLASIGQLVAAIMIAVGINSDVVGRRAWHDKFADGTQVIKIG